MTTEENDYRRVTVGEVARRLDEHRDDMKAMQLQLTQMSKDFTDALHNLQYVPRDVYDAHRQADQARLASVEAYVKVASEKPARTLQSLTRELLFPILVSLAVAALIFIWKVKGV